jgi:molybdopterin-guanine dinucleotide biosynthesis protein A
MRAAAFVVVGGQSSRMGQDKARLRTGSHLLVEEIAARIASVVPHVALVGPPERYADLPFECLPDLRPSLGPLSGLETALAADRAELNLVAGCDMPNLDPRDLARLLEIAEQTNAPCVAARDAAGRLHPLCAVYRSACLPVIQRALDEGRLRLLDLLKELNAVELPVDSVIHNLNTPQQAAAWVS